MRTYFKEALFQPVFVVVSSRSFGIALKRASFGGIKYVQGWRFGRSAVGKVVENIKTGDLYAF